MPKFQSTGTIHCHVTNSRVEEIFFVPDSDHTVNRLNKKYAIFLHRKNKEKSIVRELGDDGLSIKASCKDKKLSQKTALMDAAMNRSKVDVQVKPKRNARRLNLVGITVPARQSTK